MATVRTALAGTVRFAGRIAGRGVVVVGHGATRTTYEPVRATVAVGDEVAAGAPIGRLEVAGSHCFPAACLHWGWLRGEVYLDPLALVGARPVRLVPPGGLATGPPAGRPGRRTRPRCAGLGRCGPGPGRPRLTGPVGPVRRLSAQARGWACRYAARSRSLLTWV